MRHHSRDPFRPNDTENVLPRYYRESLKGPSQVVCIWGEKLRSPAYSKLTKRNFIVQFHTTWEGYFGAALYKPHNEGIPHWR